MGILYLNKRSIYFAILELFTKSDHPIDPTVLMLASNYSVPKYINN